MPCFPLQKIISGGQTGVDRAALDVAIFLDIEHGGWCPAGRRAEDGCIPPIYQLKQTRSHKYSVRTEQNVVDSDGTLILYRSVMTGGTELTERLARKHKRPLLCIDLETATDGDQVDFWNWLSANHIQTLNIAGPRESTCQGIASQAEKFLCKAIKATGR